MNEPLTEQQMPLASPTNQVLAEAVRRWALAEDGEGPAWAERQRHPTTPGHDDE